MDKKLDEAAERTDEDNPELTRAMLRKARPALEVLLKHIGKHATADLMRRKPGRPPSEEKRVPETFQFSEDLVGAYKQPDITGGRWSRNA